MRELIPKAELRKRDRRFSIDASVSPSDGEQLRLT
jgi:hypothetical protein